MKIAVMAAGGVGGYFGAYLAKAGHDVAFFARGAHLEALRSKGLSVKSDLGDITLSDVTATDSPADVGPVDIVLFAVKLWDTEAAAEACKPLIGPDTAVISFQNGVVSERQIGEILGDQHVVPGVAFIATVIQEPGVIRHTGTMARIMFNESDNRPSERLIAFHEACEAAGITAGMPDDIEREIWQKFIFLASLSGVTTATRRNLGAIRSDPHLARVFRACMDEIAAVGRARGVDLADDIAETQFSFALTLPDEMKSSTLHDLERGGRLEAKWLSGALHDLGAEAGVGTPVHDTLYAVVKPYEMGAA